jgi:hypothetical protein
MSESLHFEKGLGSEAKENAAALLEARGKALQKYHIIQSPSI